MRLFVTPLTGFAAVCCAVVILAVVISAGTAGAASGQKPRSAGVEQAVTETAQAAPVQQEQQVTLTPAQYFAIAAAEAEKGNAQYMLLMGNFYEQGMHVARNYIKAREWYAKAAATGMPQGYYNLGVCYEIGMGTEGDMAKAVENYLKAAEGKLPLAQLKLANLYNEGLGVPKDEAKAFDYMNEAAQGGQPIAANALGMVYLRGLMGQKKDGAKAVDMFLLGADQGSLESVLNLAAIFKDGIERPASAQTALKWYLVAEKAGAAGAPLEEVIAELRKGLSKAHQSKAESEADKWLETLRQKSGAAPSENNGK